MPKRPLVIDVAEENQQLGFQPTNVGAALVTTGPEIVPIAPLGGTYWVDNTYTGGGSDGSDERPFTTIAAGLARIAAQVGFASGTLLIAGNPDYSSEGTIAIPDSITARIFAWGSPSQQPVTFAATCGTGAPLLYLRGCNVTSLTLGDSIVQADMSSIVGVSNTGGSSLVMRGGSARLAGQVCRLSGEADDVACTSMHIGAGEAALDFGTLRADACNLEAATLVAGTLEFRGTTFASATAITCSSISMDRQSERSAALAGVRPSSLPIPLEPINPIYGTGATGNLTQSVGSFLLAAADEYDNLTINGTGGVRLEFSILRVRNLLDLSAAPALAIRDYTGGGGANAVADAGGGSWGGVAGYTQGNSGTLQAQGGANGGTGVGAQPTNVPTLQQAFGGKGGGGGAGGDGAGANVGGAGRAAAAVTLERVVPHWMVAFAGPSNAVTAGSATTAPVPIMGGHVGQAGSAGGGDGAAGKGGGGGGAGRGGGSIVVYARGIALGAGTAAGAISAAGQAGGNGGNGGAAATGGGGGGAGSGGGLVLIAYDWIIGTQPAADEVSASGGAGGAGGNGQTTGKGGTGGDGGAGGQIVFWNLLTNTRTIVAGVAGTAGSAPAGAAGGAGGTGGACTSDFPT